MKPLLLFKPDLAFGKYVLFGKNTAPVRLLVACDNLAATFYLYFYFPLLNELRSGSISICAGPSSSFGVASAQLLSRFSPTHLILSRAFGPEVEELVATWAKPFFYHIDDNLLDLPHSLGDQILAFHGHPRVLKSRKSLILGSREVWTSASYLRDVLKTQLPDANIIFASPPPYLRDHLLKCSFFERMKCHLAGPTRSNKITLGFMGSKGHWRDMEMLIAPLRTLLRNFPRVRFETFGTIDLRGAFKSFQNQYRHHSPEKDYLSFLRKLRSLGWTYGLAPLLDDEFNRCKSPIKFLEYSAAEITTLASKVMPYELIENERTGYLIGKDSWEDSLQNLVVNRSVIGMSTEAQHFCESSFSLEQNKKRLFQLLGLSEV
jgi:hypothetical protein